MFQGLRPLLLLKKRNALAQQVSGCCKAHANNLTGFTPQVLANLVAWFRSDDLVISGTDILQVNDKSGNGLHLDTPSVNNPQYVASDSNFNGKPVMNFSQAQTNWIERATGTFLSAGHNVFTVLRGEILGITKAYCATQVFLDAAQYVVGGTAVLGINSGTLLLGTSNTLNTVSLSDIWWNNTASELTRDGVIETTGDAGGDPVAAGFVLGSFANKTNPFEGSIAEIIITSSHIDDTSAEYAGLMQYLNLRYGLSLPTIRT